jgi:hypothetical protein
MNDDQKAIAIRLLREQEAQRSNTNNIIRKRFGDRITIALTSECAHRDREIDAIEATIALLNKPAS